MMMNEEMNEPMSEEELRGMMDQLDVNRDGVITFDEWWAWFCREGDATVADTKALRKLRKKLRWDTAILRRKRAVKRAVNAKKEATKEAVKAGAAASKEKLRRLGAKPEVLALMDMGYSRKMSSRAVFKSRGDLEQAKEWAAEAKAEEEENKRYRAEMRAKELAERASRPKTLGQLMFAKVKKRFVKSDRPDDMLEGETEEEYYARVAGEYFTQGGGGDGGSSDAGSAESGSGGSASGLSSGSGYSG